MSASSASSRWSLGRHSARISADSAARCSTSKLDCAVFSSRSAASCSSPPLVLVVAAAAAAISADARVFLLPLPVAHTLSSLNLTPTAKMALRHAARRLSTSTQARSASWFDWLSDRTMAVSGYRKYGLRREDLLREELPGVREAISRLPQEVQDERYFRLKRAMNVSLRQQYLPKEEWTTAEEDKEDYLKPMLKRVEQELAEKQAWNSQ
eukprot:m.177858 g.177858  ORF g.177858 m.177858 type:complete len:210 (+) comp17972_c4_seq1:432-1061(+)